LDSDGYLSQLADIFNGITVNTPSISAIIAIALAGVLLLASGFASASEIAFFSLSPSDRNDIDERNHPSDDKISALLGDTERLLATILITNNFVNVTIIMLCNFFFMNVFVFHSPLAEFLILTVILTFLLLLFGEIMPKIYSAQKTLAFCRFSAPGIYFLEKVFRPIATVLVRSTTFLNKHFVKKSHNISVDELSHALELTDKAELSEENNILEGIIRFGGETVKEVMTSRLDMVDLDVRTSFKEVMQCIIENAYSRIPIYSGSRDNIKGVLYIKDLLPHVNKGDNFRWQSLIRPAYFVPETKMIDDLLRDFQAEFTFNFEQHTCQCICISHHLFKFVFVYFCNLIEIRQLRFRFKYPGMVIQNNVRTLFIIVFVVNLTYNLFDNILHRYQSGSSSKLIHNNSNMNLIRLEVTQQIINHLRLQIHWQVCCSKLKVNSRRCMRK